MGVPVRTNHNQSITDILEVMQKKSDASGYAHAHALSVCMCAHHCAGALVALHRDKWRSFAYRKAVAALKAHPRPINSAAEALKVRGVGKGIAEKVRLASLSS
jgi:hypothetical protein